MKDNDTVVWIHHLTVVRAKTPAGAALDVCMHGGIDWSLDDRVRSRLVGNARLLNPTPAGIRPKPEIVSFPF